MHDGDIGKPMRRRHQGKLVKDHSGPLLTRSELHVERLPEGRYETARWWNGQFHHSKPAVVHAEANVRRSEVREESIREFLMDAGVRTAAIFMGNRTPLETQIGLGSRRGCRIKGELLLEYPGAR